MEMGSSCFSIFHAWQHSTTCFLSDSRGTERRQCPFHDTSAFLHQYTTSTNTSVSSLSMSSIGASAAATSFQHIADQIHVGLVMSYNAVGSTHKFNITANVMCKEQL